VPEPELVNLGQRLVLNLDPSAGEEHHAEFSGDSHRSGTGHHGAYDYGAAPRRAVSRRRLRPLLRDLVRSPAFRRSTTLVSQPGFPELPVSRFFINLDQITQHYEGKKRGYWGTIIDAKQRGPEDALWLNSGAPEDVSLLIRPRHISAVLDAHHLSDADELAGAWVLALGEYRTSQTGKRLVRVDSPAFIALRLADDHAT
jgi:hypothetical protein